MNENFNGELRVIGMRGCEDFASQVDFYLKKWRHSEKTFIADAQCPRFGSGEAKALINESMRGLDLYIITDCFNYGVTYKMYGMQVPMSPDDHFQDLKRIIAATGGKPRRISVIMPMLYEGRQHKRTARESLDCALALKEITEMGVSNIITFDAHDPRVQNAIPLHGFDSVRPTYQMLKALLKEVPNIKVDKDSLMVVSPDEGALDRAMYIASVAGIELGMFYKRRNYSIIIDGKNPIEAHEYLGNDLHGKDAIVVDDMISSGDSMIDVSLQLKQRGAKRVFVFATFALFCNGLEKFDKAYKEGVIDKIFATNLTYHTPEILSREWFCSVNMSKYVSYLIDTINRDDSISDLLNPAKKIHNLLDKYNNNGTEEFEED
ncbi:MAG: ribose-phosphate pyrophosphokinase [Eubacteriales bacterium]